MHNVLNLAVSQSVRLSIRQSVDSSFGGWVPDKLNKCNTMEEQLLPEEVGGVETTSQQTRATGNVALWF